MNTTTKGADTDVRAIVAGFPGLSERQCSYLNNFLTGQSKIDAAINAGYSGAAALAVHRSPRVQAALALAVERFLVGELAPAAIHVISRLMADDKTPAGVRGNLALGVLDRAGYSAKRHEKQAAQGKDASQMTRDELQAEIDKLAREIEGRMVDVTPDGVPDSEPIEAQAIDLYE